MPEPDRLKGLFTSNTPEWATPKAFFEQLNREFKFNLDPCATAQNAKCKKFFTQKDNGLLKPWNGKRVFCNPPYGKVIGDWVKKCALEPTSICVALLPARTDTHWFHDHIYENAEIRFIKGRLKFNDGKQSAPFPSMICIWR